jgi:hypothetical protein
LTKDGTVERVQRKTKDANGVEHVRGYSPYTIRGTLVPLSRRRKRPPLDPIGDPAT